MQYSPQQANSGVDFAQLSRAGTIRDYGPRGYRDPRLVSTPLGSGNMSLLEAWTGSGLLPAGSPYDATSADFPIEFDFPEWELTSDLSFPEAPAFGGPTFTPPAGLGGIGIGGFGGQGAQGGNWNFNLNFGRLGWGGLGGFLGGLGWSPRGGAAPGAATRGNAAGLFAGASGLRGGPCVSPPRNAVLANLIAKRNLDPAVAMLGDMPASGLGMGGTGVTPVGGIILWSGAAADVPHNWAICNGSNGTPNLLDRFVICAGVTYAVAATGGETVHGAGVNDHTDHAVGSYSSLYGAGGTSVTEDTGAGHSETTNLPPYYALAYIMRVS